MRAAALDRFGGVETIQMKTLPVPEPGPDEALLRVESAGVGVWDPYEREGEFAKIFGTKPDFHMCSARMARGQLQPSVKKFVVLKKATVPTQ